MNQVKAFVSELETQHRDAERELEWQDERARRQRAAELFGSSPGYEDEDELDSED
jgi:hypothetical protein